MAVVVQRLARLHVVEPAASASVDGWLRHEWPEDLPRTGLVALRVPLPVRVGTRFVRNGWQSWSAPTVGRLGGRVTRPDGRAARAMYHLFADPAYDGDESYDVLAADGFVAGFLSGGGVLVARPATGDLLAVREAGGPHPALWCASGDADALLADLLRRCAGRVPTRLPVGWSSWTAHGPRVDEALLDDELRSARGLGLDVFAVDDGYQAALGDWVAGERFPGGLDRLAARVREEGLTPGLWLAPFLAVPHSRVVTEHPEWVLRDESGEPVPVTDVDYWSGRTLALDASRDDVLEHVAATVRRLVETGFGYLKLDFLYAAAMAGEHAVPGPADRRLRRALATLREAAGDETFVVGCGSPLWPAIGLVDAMRIGPDVTPTWGSDNGEQAACLSNGWRAARLRAPMHGRLWANDPDAVFLRRLRPPVVDDLTDAERHGFARWVAASGQVLFDSDRLADLTDGDRAEWSVLVARHRAGPDQTESVALARVPAPRAPAEAGPVELAEGLWAVAGPGITHSWDANAYLLTPGAPVLIDCGSPAGSPALLRNLGACGVAPGDLVAVVATHGHWDHVGGAAALAAHGAPLLVHPGDLEAVRTGDPVLTTASLLYGASFPPVAEAVALDDGAVLRCGEASIHVVATPGHTPGSVCFLLKLGGRRILLAGDTLFGGFSAAIGSDLEAWRRSLERIADLDADLLSWGHGPPELVDDVPRRLAEAQAMFGAFLDPWFKPFHRRFVY